MASIVSAASSAELYPVPIEPRARRLESVDLLRGLLMILMALDHTRDYFTNVSIDPVDPHSSWPVLFITRWVTHLCAPGFIALAGASVYLQRQRGKTSGQLQKLLITRGLWLIFLEITVISFGWTFVFAPFLQVIWAVGISMVCLGLIIRLPVWAIGSLGAAIALLHNLLDLVKAESLGPYANLWRLTHDPGLLFLHGHLVGLAYYAALPWFAIICLGYAFGVVVASAPAWRRRISCLLSATFLTTFALLRLIHGYGDTFKFEHLATPAHTAMSFVDVQKYPPSLQYMLATFGVLLLLYTGFDYAAEANRLPRVRAVFETYGRVPFFYYVPHIYLLHTAALLTCMAVGKDWHFFVGVGFLTGNLAGWGYSLPVVYAIWIAAVASLYLPCKWFAGVKARRRDWWLSYI